MNQYLKKSQESKLINRRNNYLIDSPHIHKIDFLPKEQVKTLKKSKDNRKKYVFYCKIGGLK